MPKGESSERNFRRAKQLLDWQILNMRDITG